MKHLRKDGYLSEDEVSSKYPFVLIVTHKRKGMRQDGFLCIFFKSFDQKLSNAPTPKSFGQKLAEIFEFIVSRSGGFFLQKTPSPGKNAAIL